MCGFLNSSSVLTPLPSFASPSQSAMPPYMSAGMGEGTSSKGFPPPLVFVLLFVFVFPFPLPTDGECTSSKGFPWANRVVCCDVGDRSTPAICGGTVCPVLPALPIRPKPSPTVPTPAYPEVDLGICEYDGDFVSNAPPSRCLAGALPWARILLPVLPITACGGDCICARSPWMCV